MNETIMTEAFHRERHRQLHRALDELIADFIDKTGKMPSDTTVMELMEWSHRQTLKPDTESAPFRWEDPDTPPPDAASVEAGGG